MASSLGAFLETMYKKRELEYKAALDQSKADVAGAEAIGSGIASIGNAVGKIGGGIGGYMQQSQADKVAMSIGREEGVPLTSTGFGASRELEMRMKAGQIGGQDEGMTPYQEAQSSLAERRLGFDVQKENARAHENRLREAGLANKNASKGYLEDVNDTLAYQKDANAHYHKLLDAETPEAFEQEKQYLTAINQAYVKKGYDPSKMQAFPEQFVPKSQSTDELPPGYPAQPRYAPPRYAPGVQSDVGRRTTGIPPGAIPVPKLQGQPAGITGTYNGQPYIWDGNFMIPNQNR